MFLYFHSDKFLISIEKLETKGNPIFVIFWTPFIQRYSNIFSYKEFIDSFVHAIMNMLTSSYQPRISEEIKRVL